MIVEKGWLQFKLGQPNLYLKLFGNPSFIIQKPDDARGNSARILARD